MTGGGVNPHARLVRAASPVRLDDAAAVRRRRVLVVEDGPTITHGRMPHGAGFVAATAAGATRTGPPGPTVSPPSPRCSSSDARSLRSSASPRIFARHASQMSSSWVSLSQTLQDVLSSVSATGTGAIGVAGSAAGTVTTRQLARSVTAAATLRAVRARLPSVHALHER